MFYAEPKTLIVVYRNELLVNQLKKLVETNDDHDEESIVGVKDGSVRIVSWTEKVWNDQKKAGNINNRVLFLGDFKDTKTLVPIMETKYDSFGIKYGWAGNQALIVADPTVFSNRDIYGKFVYCIKQYDLPISLKPVEPLEGNKDVLTKDELPKEIMTETSGEPKEGKYEAAVDSKQKKKIGFATAIGKTISFVGKAANAISTGVSHTVSQIGSAIDDLPADRLMLMTQQYYLGIMKFYENHLEEFMQK